MIPGAMLGHSIMLMYLNMERLDRLAVAGADAGPAPRRLGILQATADSDKFLHGGREDQRAAMRNASFNDQVGLQAWGHLIRLRNALGQ